MLNFSPLFHDHSLGGLLSETFDLLKRRAQVILVAAVVLGLLLSALNMYLIPVKTGMFSGMFGNLGMNTERLEELSKRMEQGDEAALNEMMKEFEAGAKRWKICRRATHKPSLPVSTHPCFPSRSSGVLSPGRSSFWG